MAKRFIDTDIWEEDWFILLPPMYKLLWKWICDKCDHSGIWKPNLETFKKFNGEVNISKALEYYNDDEKIRLLKLDNGKFLIPGFFAFQYGEKLNTNNKVHLSIYQIYCKNGVNLTSIRGLVEVNHTPMDMDKDKEKDKEEKESTREKETKQSKPEKIKYSELVSMTNEEHSKLIEKYGKEVAANCILALDNYKGSSGKKYKDDYRAILSWVIDKVTAKKIPNGNGFTNYNSSQNVKPIIASNYAELANKPHTPKY